MNKKAKQEVERRVKEILEQEREHKRAIFEGSDEIVRIFNGILNRCETPRDVDDVYKWLTNGVVRMSEERYAELFNAEQWEKLGAVMFGSKT